MTAGDICFNRQFSRPRKPFFGARTQIAKKQYIDAFIRQNRIT